MQTPKFDSFNDKFKKYFNRKKPSIDEVVREPTAGGIVFRRNKKTKEIEILLFKMPKTAGLYQRAISKKVKMPRLQLHVKLARKQDLKKSMSIIG